MINFKLKQLLSELKITRNKFALLSGIRPNTISDMCNGETKRLELETLDCILKTLNQISNKPILLMDLIEYRQAQNEINKGNNFQCKRRE